MSTQKVQFIIEAIDQASKELKAVTDGVDSMGKKSKISSADVALAGAAISGSIIKIGADAVNVFKGFEKTMSGVNAVLEPTKEDFAALSTLARDLGKSTAYSAMESADMMEMLAKNGLNATQILNGAAQASLNLAAATGADLTNAADIASSAMTVFWKGVEDLDQVVNSITGTTNVSKFGIEDYALAMSQGWGAAATFGVSLQDFNTSIAAISPLFASGSDAGTSFKTFLLRLKPATDNAYSAMRDLGIITEDGKNRFYDATGSMKSMAEVSEILKETTGDLSDEQKNAAYNTIFGTDALRTAAAMAGVGAEKFADMQKAIEWTDAAKNAATRLDNLAGSIETLSGATQELQLQLGSMLEPAIRAITDGLTWMAQGISTVMNWINQLPGPIASAIQLFGGLVIAGVALTAMWAAMAVTMGGVAAAMWAILAPALPIIAVAAAIVAGLYLLYQGAKVLIDFFTGAWNSNLGGVRDFTMGVWENIKLVFEGVMGVIRTVADAGMQFLAMLWENKMTIISTIWNLFWDAALFPLELAIQAITVAVTAFYQLFTGDWDGFVTTLSNAWTNSWNAIAAFGKTLWENLKISGTAVFNAFATLLSGIWTTVKGNFVISWNAIKDVAMDVWNNLVAWFNGAGGTAFVNAFSSIGTSIGNVMKGIWNGILATIETFMNIAVNGINRLIEASNKVNPIGAIWTIAPFNFGRMAHGGVVRGPMGLDTVPTMLTAGEVVLNAAQQGNVARAIEGSGGGGLTIILKDNQFFWSDDAFVEKVGDKLMEIFKFHTAIQTQ